jgi:hypothetical protein
LATDPSRAELLRDLRLRLDRFMAETNDPAATDSIPPPPNGVRCS